MSIFGKTLLQHLYILQIKNPIKAKKWIEIRMFNNHEISIQLQFNVYNRAILLHGPFKDLSR